MMDWEAVRKRDSIDCGWRYAGFVCCRCIGVASCRPCAAQYLGPSVAGQVPFGLFRSGRGYYGASTRCTSRSHFLVRTIVFRPAIFSDVGSCPLHTALVP